MSEIRPLTCKELDELLKLMRKGDLPKPRLGKPKLVIVRKQEK